MNTVSDYLRLTGTSESNCVQLLALTNGMTSTDAVLSQMSEDYPMSSLKWMKSYQWEWPHAVPLGDIDFSNKSAWNAQANQDKIKLFKKKIMKGTMKPALLVKPKGASKYVVVDGHHRALTCLLLKRPLMAWTTDTDTRNGPWDDLHDQQTSGSSIKASNIELSAKTGELSTSSTPLGSGKLWHKRDPSIRLPDYIRNIAKALERNGHSESESIQIAIGAVRRWSSGNSKVSPEVRAAASTALAKWNELKERAKTAK